MLCVYQLMMLGVALSGAVTLYLVSNQPLLKQLASHPLFFAVIFLGTLGLSWFSGSILEVAKAFFIAAGLFGGASHYGYTTKNDLSGVSLRSWTLPPSRPGKHRTSKTCTRRPRTTRIATAW